jgi:hypothetical protein
MVEKPTVEMPSLYATISIKMPYLYSLNIGLDSSVDSLDRLYLKLTLIKCTILFLHIFMCNIHLSDCWFASGQWCSNPVWFVAEGCFSSVLSVLRLTWDSLWFMCGDVTIQYVCVLVAWLVQCSFWRRILLGGGFLWWLFSCNDVSVWPYYIFNIVLWWSPAVELWWQKMCLQYCGVVVA